MSDDLVLYTNPQSRGRITRWMLEEVGCDYRVECLEYRTTMKAPEYLAINPMGKVPAIRHGDVVVTEGAAICAYLADAFPEAGLAPSPGDPARGPYYRWLFYTAGPLESAVADRSLGLEVPEERRASIGYGSYDRVMDVLEHELAPREFIAGDRFSAADLFLSSMLGFGMMFGTIEKRPAFSRYAERHLARPAALCAQQKDDALAAAGG